MVLARLAGDKLNTALVKAFVNAITFFPIGSLVRTTLNETGIVVRVNDQDPLHPVIVLVDDRLNPVSEVDTSARDVNNEYVRHVAETLRPPSDTLDLAPYFPSAHAA